MLFLFTGSVVLPLKAIVLNIISLGATLGVLAWVFQDGHLKGAGRGLPATGTVDTSMIVLIAILAFALSMDYEVFLLSRIKEEHDAAAGHRAGRRARPAALGPDHHRGGGPARGRLRRLRHAAA